MRISKYITFAEATKSNTATRRDIDNTPGEEELENMKFVASQVFDPIREMIGHPLGVSSFFRSAELNKAIGGALSSQHVKGEAIDIDADIFGFGTNAQIFHEIRDNYQFDQLIWEYGTDANPAWVHVSLKKSGNRNQVLRVKRINNKTVYENL